MLNSNRLACLSLFLITFFSMDVENHRGKSTDGFHYLSLFFTTIYHLRCQSLIVRH